MKPAASAARNNPRAGFTLLETLAALAIAAAAFAVIVDFSMRTLRNWHRGDQAIAAMEMITRGIGRLQMDLAVSLPMSVPGGDGAAVLFKGDANGLVFAAATGFGTGNRGVELISVSAFQDREDIALIRNRGPVAFPQPELGDPVVLMRGRMRVRFSYRDNNGKTAPTWIEQPELPAAVAIEIFGAQGNPILPVPALITLPQNYSVECFNPPSDKANIQVRCTQENNEQDADPDNQSQPGQRRE
ncbi:MAG: ral secretion pathway protein [Alphaproteobacteria bacterium]|nr:ral secretion pathway protein [Alphaproteobacteria bacterium]